MRITQLLSFAAVVGFIACSQVGCASAKTVGDEKSSAFGGTQTIVYGDPIAVTNAAKAVAADLELTVVSSTASGLDGKVVTETSTKKKVTVNVKTAGEGYSRLTVKASGLGGDRTIQKQVLDRIRAKLPEAPEGTTPPVALTPAKGSSASAKPAPKASAAPTAKTAPVSTPAPQTQEQPTNTAHLPF